MGKIVRSGGKPFPQGEYSELGAARKGQKHARSGILPRGAFQMMIPPLQKAGKSTGMTAFKQRTLLAAQLPGGFLSGQPSHIHPGSALTGFRKKIRAALFFGWHGFALRNTDSGAVGMVWVRQRVSSPGTPSFQAA